MRGTIVYEPFEIIEETETKRVVLFDDPDPDAPYDDGSSPLLRLYSFRNDWRAEQVTEVTSYVVHPRIVEALARWARDSSLFERYCRIFHGATTFQYWDSFVSLDPADWREKVGAPAGSVSTKEWRAYIDGDVYGIAEQEVVTVTATNQSGEEVSRRQDWLTTDSVWGFYGYEYAVEAARETYLSEPNV
jgi:hypothetical protein